jgi:hypothetical protein
MFPFNSKKKNKTTIDAKVLFHKESNDFPEHGSIYVDHVQHRLKNEPVRFSFVGIAPPQMTPEVLAHIWDQAERQGYKVYKLRSYADVMNVTPAPVLRPREEEPKPVVTPRPWDQSQHRTPVSRGLRRPSENHAAPSAQ